MTNGELLLKRLRTARGRYQEMLQLVMAQKDAMTEEVPQVELFMKCMTQEEQMIVAQDRAEKLTDEALVDIGRVGGYRTLPECVDVGRILDKIMMVIEEIVFERAQIELVTVERKTVIVEELGKLRIKRRHDAQRVQGLSPDLHTDREV